jgi:3-hydroxybutyryl-CoA dehydrogenase
MLVETNPIERVCVVGAGFMGAQIALRCASHGFDVRVVDTAPQALERAAKIQARDLTSLIEEGRVPAREHDAILGRIWLGQDMAQGAGGADFVIEAVPERLEVKRAVFAELDRICPPRTILATNSSSIRISLIEDVTQRPDRVLNMHFYTPVWLRPMVDLMRGTGTSVQTFETARQFALRIGVMPLLVRKESTGFLFNRIWRAIKKECMRVVGSGVASHEDVDRAWMIFLGQPLGPFGMMDSIGLDVVRDIEMVYYRESGDESDAPPRVLLEKIEKGELGVKAGKGFYGYPKPAYQDPDFLKPR